MVGRGMRIGVAKEIKQDEYRVALTPAGAGELRQRGHEVVVESGAGVGSTFPDAEYEAVGARIASVGRGAQRWAIADSQPAPPANSSRAGCSAAWTMSSATTSGAYTGEAGLGGPGSRLRAMRNSGVSMPWGWIWVTRTGLPSCSSSMRSDRSSADSPCLEAL